MFIDQEWKKQEGDIQGSSIEEDIAQQKKKRKIIFYAVAVFVLLIATVSFVFLYLNTKNNEQILLIQRASNKTVKSTSTAAVLPSDLGGGGDGTQNGGNQSIVKAEEMRFGSFYEKPEALGHTSSSLFSLPINIKSDVLNYYDVSRKVGLEDKIPELNANGFSMLDTQLDSDTSDFFAMYRSLLNSQVPLFVSSDFISYYYQNNLKQIYKDIEKNVFYEDLWNIDKKLYDISLAQYKNVLDKKGVVNDPVLEGERLKTVFLAVSLKLLKPKADQINQDENFADENKFTLQESGNFYFDVPSDLQSEVDKEASLILGAKAAAKSPVFLYEKDYTVFKVPVEYASNAKLKNYYQAKKWMNSFFPLFYKNEDCPDCVLDYNDWMNNFAAAALLSEDLKNNQEIKNEWALIYKFIGFFEGLKSDLTYLQYNDAFKQVFSDSYSIPMIFSNDNGQRKENLISLQNEIVKNKFLPIEGGTLAQDKKDLGMRMLQDNYWPSDYIFSRLAGADLVSQGNKDYKNVYTACQEEKNVSYRCVGFGGDILSLMSVLPKNISYFQENTDYLNYNEKIAGLQDQLSQFDKFNWNSNMYWMNFDLSKTFSDFYAKNLDLISKNSFWMDQKAVNSVLGSWTNVGLPADAWENYQDAKSGNLSFSVGCDLHSYVEPSVTFYADMIKRNNMLLKSIEVLRVGSNINAATIAINEMNKNLNYIKNTAEKELNGEIMNEESCQTLKDFVSNMKVKTEGVKSLVIKQNQKKLKEDISGVKLMAYVYSVNPEEKILVVGPVFNYREQIK
jgi:hypothetical protein